MSSRGSRSAATNRGITLKVRPSKLRQATSSSQIKRSPYVDADTPSDSDATPQPVARTARSTRNPRTVVEPESDELDDEEMEDEVEQEVEDEEGEDMEQDEENEDSEEDAEGDEDDEMDELQQPAAPARSQGKGKGTIVVSTRPRAPVKSVEDKEMEDDDDDDEELSELDSNDENENEGDEMDEGAEDEDDMDEDDDEDMDGSRGGTPDLSKLTRRQRGLFEEQPEETHDGLLSLSNEATKKKHFTDEENKMRRLEMARRRKDLSEKRNEEEKRETIDKLLKKPAPKRRTRAEMIAAQHAEEFGTPGAEDGVYERTADPLYTRWITNRDGSKVAVPAEWLEAPVGDVFSKSKGSGRMIEEVA